MAENESLTDTVHHAISAWAAANDSSMVTNFMLVAEFIEADGKPSAVVAAPDNCSTAAGLGLSQYALNMFVEIQRRDVLSVIYSDMDDDDE